MRRLNMALLLATSAASGAEFSVDARVAPEWHDPNSRSPLFVPEPFAEFERYNSKQELDLRYQRGGVNGVAAAHWDIHEHARPDFEGVVNELYYDAAWGAHYFSVGKKVLSWGVGYGFRPLDVVQRENRRLPYAVTPEGVPLLAWEIFDADHAFTVVYANPLRDEARHARDDEAVAARYYHRADAADVYAVTRLSARNQFEIGAAFSHVVDDAIEWHGEWLYQRRFEQPVNALAMQSDATLATADPFVSQTYSHGHKVLLGFTWTHASGVSLLGEAWYDAEAYSRAQWRDLLALVERQRALLGAQIPPALIYGNIAWNMRHLESPNLLRRNNLLRVSYTGTSWTPALDVLHTPEDGGMVTTASARYDGNRQQVEFGVRAFGGPRDAAVRLVPEDFSAYCLWRRALP
jgi:hypothetical protein